MPSCHQAMLRLCAARAYLHEVIAQGRAGVILEGLADAELPLTAALVPVLPIAHLQLGVQVARALLVPELKLGTPPPKEIREEAWSAQSLGLLAATHRGSSGQTVP